MALVVDQVSSVEPISRVNELNQQPVDPSRPTTSFVHHLVKVDQAISKGLGLFATGVIQEAEIVAWESADLYQGLNDHRPGKKLMTFAQIEERWPDKRERDHFVAYSYQVGEDLFLIPLREDDLVITTYQNHSCDPNTWWADDFTLVARRTIHAGEEVTFDYSTSESLENPEMPDCFCASPICRGKLEPLDYLKPELIEQYGTHFVSYLRQRQLKHFGDSLPNSPKTPAFHKDRHNASAVEQSIISASFSGEKCWDDGESPAEKYNMHGRKS